MSPASLPQLVAGLIPLLLSLSFHEYAHAWTASRLGDDTAERAGRFTLNPLAHIDLLGTIILPLVLAFTGSGFMFGWAKPVPVNPGRFRRDVHMGRGMAWTAAAGPLSNVVLAVISAIGAGLLMRFAPQTLQPGSGIRELVGSMLGINVVLALFNLIPIPPLDGSRIVDGYMPFRFRPAWDRITALAPFLLIGVFFFGGRLIAGPSDYVMTLLLKLAYSIGAA